MPFLISELIASMCNSQWVHDFWSVRDPDLEKLSGCLRALAGVKFNSSHQDIVGLLLPVIARIAASPNSLVGLEKSSTTSTQPDPLSRLQGGRHEAGLEGLSVTERHPPIALHHPAVDIRTARALQGPAAPREPAWLEVTLGFQDLDVLALPSRLLSPARIW